MIIIWIIIIIFILCYFYQTKIIEGYDARYTNTSFEKCAEFSKTTSGCYGFGYNKKNNTCYPSALPIFGLPLDSIFKGEYSYSNATCNKVKTIELPKKDPAFEERRSNSVYVCTESDGMQPQYYFHNKNKFENIGEGRNIDDIFDVEMYEVRDFQWPRNRFDYDQQDLLLKEKEGQAFVPNNITDLNRIIKFIPVKEKETKIVKPTINVKPKYDFNLDIIVKNIIDRIKKFIPSLQLWKS